MPDPALRPIPRSLQFALFVTTMVWTAAAWQIAGRAAQGIATRVGLGLAPQTLLESIFVLFLVIVGFSALDWIAARGWQHVPVLPLPARKTRAAEWGTGAALGWAAALVTMLPVLLSGHLHANLMRPVAWLPVLLALVTIAILSLAEEAIFRGYPFQRLATAIGPTGAAILMSVLFAAVLVGSNPPRHLMFALLDAFAFGLLLAMAYLRTHALWLGWGLHFAYRAVTGVVLGLPLLGRSSGASLAESYATGPRWLAGGAFGLDAALLTAIVLLLAVAVLYRLTDDFAWQYTRREIVSAGYEVAIAPPAAHVAMEKAAAPPALVQILPTTPQDRSRPSGEPGTG